MSITNPPYTVFSSYNHANTVALYLNQDRITQNENDWTYTVCLHNDGRAIINIYDDDGVFLGLL